MPTSQSTSHRSRLSLITTTLQTCLALLFALGMLPGCKEFAVAKKFDNPVAPPPPRRIAVAPRSTNDSVAAQSPSDADDIEIDVAADSAIKPKTRGPVTLNSPDAIRVSASVPEKSTDQTFEDSEVVATVNGQPLFARDILEPYHSRLQQAKRQTTPEEYAQIRIYLLHKNMNDAIARAVLTQGMREKYKPAQIEQFMKYADSKFDERLNDVMLQKGVASRGELEVALREEGASIEQMRNSYRNVAMSQHFLTTKVKETKNIDRPELLAYYQEHIAEYEIPLQFRWQQMIILFQDHGGPQGALQFANEIRQQLDAGADFGDLVKQHSKGPKARAGGVWDWTREGSMAAKETERLLLAMEIGGISPPIRNKNNIEIVRLLDRKGGNRQKFEDVQEEIKKKLIETQRETGFQEAIAELVAAAEVVILIEKPTINLEEQ